MINIYYRGANKEVILFDHINYKYAKSIPLIYPLIRIYVKENIVFIGSSGNSSYNFIGEYEIDDAGNYK